MQTTVKLFENNCEAAGVKFFALTYTPLYFSLNDNFIAYYGLPTSVHSRKNYLYVALTEAYYSPDHWDFILTGRRYTAANEVSERHIKKLWDVMMDSDHQAKFLVYFCNPNSAVYGKFISFEASIIYAANLQKENRIHYSEGSEFNFTAFSKTQLRRRGRIAS